MTLNEYRIWLDGMIAATDDERLKVARDTLSKVVEPAPVVIPSWPHLPDMSPPPFVTTPYIPNYWPTVTCTTGSISGTSDPNIRCWNGAIQ